MANKPLEWTGRHKLSASPLQEACLPLRGSVGLSRCAADCKKKAYYIDSLSGFLGDFCLDSKGLQA
jgi:hypothetical protein